MGSKKKKSDKKKDFVKPKLRVGKTQQKPLNQTDISFKSKSISLPKQLSLVQDHLNLKKEIDHNIILLKHHNSQSKKEVIIRLIQIITKENSINPINLNNFPFDELLIKLKPLIIDQSKQVRDATKDLFKLIGDLKPSILTLHQNSIILFILSGMTHINPSIKNDSINFLKIILLNSNVEVKDSVIRSNFAKILKSLFQLLNFSIDGGKLKNSKSLSFSITTSNVNTNKSNNLDRKLDQLNVLKDLIESSCIEPKSSEHNSDDDNEDNNENSNTFQYHALTNIYLNNNKPNAYGYLNLFTKFEFKNSNNNSNGSSSSPSYSSSSSSSSKSFKNDINPLINVDSYSCEDLDTRQKILIEIFYDGLNQGLSNIIKENDDKLIKVSNTILNDINLIKSEYDLKNDS
ncbi:unnamed protein product [[Candida] boidinii]|nr:hypothetical protein BVG19_g2719 [[Candida] boidinii]OWB52471.1 hypothetical protein B5S27_g4047 [[Candida] boidinii]GMF02342.1 unnamed protein product [[Candida] boidinii]